MGNKEIYLKNDKAFRVEALEVLKNEFNDLVTLFNEVFASIMTDLDTLTDLTTQTPDVIQYVKDSSILSDMRVCIKTNQENFSEYLALIKKYIDRLLSEIFTADDVAAQGLEELASSMEELRSVIAEYDGFLNVTGFSSGQQGEFELKFFELQNTVEEKLHIVGEKLEEALKISKGLAVAASVYSIDPVNLATGNFCYDKIDWTVQGYYPVLLKRTYNAIDDHQGVLGRNWVHNFEIYLSRHEARISILFEDGHVNYYDPNSKGEYHCTLCPDHRLTQSDDQYVLITGIGERYIFDGKGRLIRLKDEGQAELVLTYNTQAQLIKVESPSGYIQFSYNHEGLLARITDQAQNTVRYAYTEQGLSRVTYPMEANIQYQYDQKGWLCAVRNERGSTIVKNEMDEKRRTTRQVFPDGGEMLYRYLDDIKQVVLTQQNGNKIVYEHDDQFRSVKTSYKDGVETTVYNQNNKRIKTVDKKGHITTFSYDAHGNLIGRVNALGEKTAASFDMSNHPLQIRKHNGAVYSFSYDKAGNLATVKNPLNLEVHYSYDTLNRVVQVKREDGSSIHIQYDKRGNVTKLQMPNGGTIAYEYDLGNRITMLENPEGDQARFQYDAAGNMVSIQNAKGYIKQYSYGPNGKITRVEDFDGSTIQLAYNTLGKISRLTDPTGTVTQFEYDVMWNLSKIVRSNGTETHFFYNDLNQLVRIKKADGHECVYAYDSSGNRIYERDENNRVTQYAYDALNRVSRVTLPDGSSISYEYNSSHKRTKISHSAGACTTFEYDLLGQLLQKTDPAGNKTKYTYTPLGQVQSVTEPGGAVTTYDYYPGGQLKSVTKPEGESESYRYNLNGLLIEKTIGGEHRTIYTYDQLGQVIAIVNPLGDSDTFTYDAAGRVIMHRNAQGTVMQYSYTPTGKLSRVRDALGGEIAYEYDAVGNLTKIEQLGLISPALREAGQINQKAKGVTRLQLEYDLMDRLIKATDADGNQELFEYDGTGNLIQKTDADGYTTQWHYALDGKIAEILYSDGKQVQYQYNALRQLVQITDGLLGTIDITPDTLGRPLAINAYGDTVRYSWNAQGQKESITYPDGRTVLYQYNRSRRLVGVRDGSDQYQYVYDRFGRLTEKLFPDHARSVYRYDKANHLTEFAHWRHDQVDERFAYHYDQLGNITKMEAFRLGIPEDSGITQYQYDPMSRISAVIKDSQTVRQYTYDDLGNRVQKTENGVHTEYHYNALNQLILQDSTNENMAFTYDKRGNLSEAWKNGVLETTYCFDATNRLSEVVHLDGCHASYQYDGLGARIASVVSLPDRSVQSSRYLLDYTRQYENILEQIQDDGRQQYVWDQDLLAVGDDSYSINDRQGTPLRLKTKDGSLRGKFAYDEFGVPLIRETEEAQPFGYTGYHTDEVSGLYFAQARYYRPEQGRFISKDPLLGRLSLPDSLHDYAYVMNRPLRFTDKLGLEFDESDMEYYYETGKSAGEEFSLEYFLTDDDIMGELYKQKLIGDFSAGDLLEKFWIIGAPIAFLNTLRKQKAERNQYILSGGESGVYRTNWHILGNAFGEAGKAMLPFPISLLIDTRDYSQQKEMKRLLDVDISDMTADDLTLIFDANLSESKIKLARRLYEEYFGNGKPYQPPCLD